MHFSYFVEIQATTQYSQPQYSNLLTLLSRKGNTQDLPVVVVHSWATGLLVGATGFGVVVSILVVVVVFTTVVVGFCVGGFVGAGGGGVDGFVCAGEGGAGEGGGCVEGLGAGGAVAGCVGCGPGNIVVVGWQPSEVLVF